MNNILERELEKLVQSFEPNFASQEYIAEVLKRLWNDQKLSRDDIHYIAAKLILAY